MEYPKMLYMGTKQNYSYVIADDELHETNLKEKGCVDFKDLEDAEIAPVDSQTDSSDAVNFQEKLNTANVEIERLNSVIKAGIAENTELRKENTALRYGAMDAADLKVILDERGVKYGSRDGKDILVDLVLKSENQG